MYWGAGTPLGEACHDSIGMDAPHTTFYLPDGETGNGMETWTLVQNPNPTSVTVLITYMTPDGKGNVTKTETIPASSRRSFSMLEHSGINGRASVTVTSRTTGKKIMFERAMYWNSRGAGTDTIGGYGDWNAHMGSALNCILQRQSCALLLDGILTEVNPVQ